MSELIKLAVLIPLYFVVAPLIGMAIRSFRNIQKGVFFLLLFVTALSYRWISTSPGFPSEFYRGHTRGYECTLMDVFAIILIFSGRGTAKERGAWMPPGAWLWLLYCAASALSIVGSVDPNFTMMVIVKFTKLILVYIAAFHFFRKDDDIRFFLSSASVVLIFQSGVCLYSKYIEHVYQVKGWFEHQNAMVMYTYMLGLPLLAASMGEEKRMQTFLWVVGFIAGGVCVESSLSRGGMIFFALGVVLTVFLSLCDRLTLKRVLTVSTLGILGAIGILVASKTIIKRFNDPFNRASEETRVILNKCSRQMLADHPVVGTGWNTYGVMINPPYTYGNAFYDWDISRGFSINPKVKPNNPISESWYYLMLAETGFVGTAACFVFFLTTVFWNARAIFYHRKTFRGVMAIGLFAGLGMNYLQSNYERVLTQPKNMAAWMICLAIVARLEWWRRQERLGLKIKQQGAEEPLPTIQIKA